MPVIPILTRALREPPAIGRLFSITATTAGTSPCTWSCSLIPKEASLQGGTGLNIYIRQYDALVKSTIKHPAVFGYLVGNEIFVGVTQNPQFWTNFGTLINAAQEIGISQGQNPFLMTAINDEFTPQTSWPAIKLGEQSGKLRNLDSWCITSIGARSLGDRAIRFSPSIWL